MQRKVSLTAQVVFNPVRCAVSDSVRTSRLSTTFHKQSGTHQISGLASVSLCNQVCPHYTLVPKGLPCSPVLQQKGHRRERLGMR